MRVLTPAAVMEAKRLYALRDEKGRPLHTLQSIAADFGVGETTIYRAIKQRGAYMNVRPLPTDAEAAASVARFQAANPDLFGSAEAPVGRVKPPNPMDDFINVDLAREKGYLK